MEMDMDMSTYMLVASMEMTFGATVEMKNRKA